MVKIYFAHPKKHYGSVTEDRVLRWIKRTFKGYEILNPSSYEIEDGRGLEYLKAMFSFYKLIETCDLMLYMGNSDGVSKERIYAMEHNISTIKIPESISKMDTY